MNKPNWLRLLFLSGASCLAAVSAARAQTLPIVAPDSDGAARSFISERVDFSAADNSPRPSHRPVDGGIGDLRGAEDLLARRLHHTRDLEELQDLVKPLLDDPAFVAQLKDKFKGMKPEDIENLQQSIQKHPELLDDPKLRDMLKEAGKFKPSGGAVALPDEKKSQLQQWAKDFIDSHKKELASGNPSTDGPPNFPQAAPADEHTNGPSPQGSIPTKAPLPHTADGPSWLNRDMVAGLAGFLKDVDRSPEGEALRAAALRDLARKGPDASGASDLAGFLKGAISSDAVSWLSRNFTPPSMPNSGGLSTGPIFSAGPSLNGASYSAVDGVVWIAALAMLGAAAWMAFTMARRQAAAARAKAWAPGPWPVLPSQVSTREDLIRAFEHLAFVCLGPVARSLNHLDVADRLGEQAEGRAEAAGRLARLYEQARYAPPEEPLPAGELTAARGDLTALAGAAA